MGRSLRIKTILLTVSLFFLIIIPVYKNNFYQKPILSEWKQLTWDDFQGTHPPFTGWAAGIYSFIELDSTEDGLIRAKALQNNQMSYRTSDMGDEDWVLRHEQYHFNITEAFTRKLNDWLDKNPEYAGEELDSALLWTRVEKNRWQNRYDSEADHGADEDQQYRWELKIDSMLWKYGLRKVGVLDHLMGVTAEFPDKPDFSFSKDEDGGTITRQYILKRYDATLYLSAFQFAETNIKVYIEYLNEQIQENNLDPIRFETTDISLNLIFYDSMDRSINYQQLKIGYPSSFIVSSYFPTHRGDSLNLIDMSEQFMSSFKAFTSGEFFANRAEELDFSAVNEIVLVNDTLSINNDDDCYTASYREYLGFLGQQFHLNNGTLLLPYQALDIADSLIDRFYLGVKDQVYEAEPSEGIVLFKIKESALPAGLNEAQIGYTLKHDLEQGCKKFYYQTISIFSNYQ